MSHEDAWRHRAESMLFTSYMVTLFAFTTWGALAVAFAAWLGFIGCGLRYAREPIHPMPRARVVKT